MPDKPWQTAQYLSADRSVPLITATLQLQLTPGWILQHVARLILLSRTGAARLVAPQIFELCHILLLFLSVG